jgi:hypoxanthine-DNA glycosylase
MIKKALAPIVDNDSRILILGTIPGERSIALQQYYGNKGNHFWKILYLVLGEQFSADYNNRKALVKKHKIALWNTLASCEREGSRDDKIKNPVVNDFELFYKSYPNIHYVFFESLSAARFYREYAYISKHILYQTLPSTSGLNAGMPYSEKLRQWYSITDFLEVL